jgi:hypothetical protein
LLLCLIQLSTLLLDFKAVVTRRVRFTPSETVCNSVRCTSAPKTKSNGGSSLNEETNNLEHPVADQKDAFLAHSVQAGSFYSQQKQFT